MKCEARIVKTYKTRKADVAWPDTYYGPNPEIKKYPEVCGGDVTVIVKAVDMPDWGGTYARMEVEATCSRCKMPYWPGRFEWEAQVFDYKGWDVTQLLEGRR